MKTKFYFAALTTIVSLTAPKVFAINLIDVYNQAFVSDTKFKQDFSQWQANKETLPIQRANLLPQLSGTVSLNRNQNKNSGAYFDRAGGNYIPYDSSYYNNTTQYALNLTQPIFNFGNWAGVWQAQATVKQAEATYLAAAEDLMMRTSKAYFAILLSQDTLRYTRANKDALRRQLDQTQHQYEVGTIAITDLENTRAGYDKSVSQEIAAVNDLDDKIEQLAEITGVRYTSFNALQDPFPLLSPDPADIERWVKAAEKQNFSLAADSFAALSARENIKIQNAGHLPTLNAIGGYTNGYNNNVSGYGDNGRSNVLAGSLSLSVPLFSGGQVVAKAKQAEYQYQQALSKQEQTHRNVVSQTRQAYLGVMSGISKVKADKQTIKSDERSLRSTRAGYTVGTRTMVEVLIAQSALFNDLNSYAADKYNLIIQTLLLKQFSGTLGIGDLQKINGWLQKPAVTQQK